MWNVTLNSHVLMFVCDVKAKLCQAQNAVVCLRVCFMYGNTHVIAQKHIPARAPRFQTFALGADCREVVSAWCRTHPGV